MNSHDVLRRAALAVLHNTDHEASFYEAQSPVEDWALDALEAAVLGEATAAQALLERYEHADWEDRRAYAVSEWDEGCRTPARAANVP